MFQVDKTVVDETGIKMTFHDGKSIQVPFSEIPADRDPGEYLSERLNELLSFEVANPRTGASEKRRHYQANVVTLSTDPLKVAVSLEAV